MTDSNFSQESMPVAEPLFTRQTMAVTFARIGAAIAAGLSLANGVANSTDLAQLALFTFLTMGIVGSAAWVLGWVVSRFMREGSPAE